MKKSLVDHIEKCARKVSIWPQWKRGDLKVAPTVKAVEEAIEEIEKEIERIKGVGKSIGMSFPDAPKWNDLSKTKPTVSHDEILIKNAQGWKRICYYLDSSTGPKFFDCYDQEIKRFNPTHWISITG